MSFVGASVLVLINFENGRLLLLIIFTLLSTISVRGKLLDNLHTFHCNDRAWRNPHLLIGVFSDPMFLWISSNSRPLNLLLVQSHQAEINIVERLFHGRSNVTRARAEPKLCEQDRYKNDVFTILSVCK